MQCVSILHHISMQYVRISIVGLRAQLQEWWPNKDYYIPCDQYYQLTDRWGLVQCPSVSCPCQHYQSWRHTGPVTSGDHPDMRK